MELSTRNLVLDADSAVDMQMHTTNSDGSWSPEQMVDYLKAEAFGMVAITDHDRVDQTAAIQQLAIEKGLPILVAAEFSANWRGHSVDVLCFGFDAENESLKAVATSVLIRQRENSRQVYDYLLKQGYQFDGETDALEGVLKRPSAGQPFALADLLTAQGLDAGAAWKMIQLGGMAFTTTPIAEVVEAVHGSGGICLIAHPGRGEFWPVFTPQLLDDIRSDVQLDGFEAYYPLHSPEQTMMFVEYAEKYDLLTSSGSDSHGRNRNPIKYPAKDSRKLLERLGVHVK
ncbi:MAG: PHP domain-containing protein [Anaerolineaceae bacterium]|nr:PHP domain-containing protein [Anaerolineaceae bacterium]